MLRPGPPAALGPRRAGGAGGSEQKPGPRGGEALSTARASLRHAPRPSLAGPAAGSRAFPAERPPAPPGSRGGGAAAPRTCPRVPRYPGNQRGRGRRRRQGRERRRSGAPGERRVPLSGSERGWSRAPPSGRGSGPSRGSAPGGVGKLRPGAPHVERRQADGGSFLQEPREQGPRSDPRRWFGEGRARVAWSAPALLVWRPVQPRSLGQRLRNSMARGRHPRFTGWPAPPPRPAFPGSSCFPSGACGGAGSSEEATRPAGAQGRRAAGVGAPGVRCQRDH